MIKGASIDQPIAVGDDQVSSVARLDIDDRTALGLQDRNGDAGQSVTKPAPA